MAYLYRLVFLFVSLFLLTFPAHAVLELKVTSNYLCPSLTPADTCAAIAAGTAIGAATNWRATTVFGVGTPSNTGATSCQLSNWPNTLTGTVVMSCTLSTSKQCVPANSSLSTDGLSCVCNSGFTEDPTKTSCVTAAAANCAAMTGVVAGAFNSPYVSGAGLNGTFTSLCDPGSAITNGSTCTVVVKYDMASIYGGVYVKSGIGYFTGATCTIGVSTPAPQIAASSPSVAPTVNPCGVGSVLGTVNGLSVCSPSSNTNVVLAGPSKVASAPGGSASSPQSGLGVDAPVTATGSSTQTTCTAGSCNTVTTYVNSSGVSVGSTTDTKSQNAFCVDNPKAAICGGSGSFSGACGAVPVCSGDAVMCAVAAATFQTNCALKMPDTSSENSAYDAAKLLTGDQTKNLPNSPTSVINVGSSAFDKTELLGASSGMTDLAITVAGQSVTLPFSTINPWLVRLGYLLQAVTFLVCAFIVTGNKQSGSA